MEKKIVQVYNYILISIFLVVHIYFTFIKNDMNIRTFNLSFILLLFSLQIAWFTLKEVKKSSRDLMSGIRFVFIVYGVINLIRIIVVFSSMATRPNELFRLGNFDAIVMFLYLMLQFVLVYVLLNLINRRILKETKLQEEKFNIAFKSSPNAVLLTRPDKGEIIEVNKGFENITGYTIKDALGKTTLDLKLWANIEDRTRLINKVLQEGRIHNEEVVFKKKNGDTWQGLFFSEIIKIDDEQLLLSTVVDISNLKKEEQALEKVKKELEETLEDFYTMRTKILSESDRVKIESENRMIRARIDELKNQSK